MDRGLSAGEPTPERSRYIERFALPTRQVHWGLAIPFLLLLLTGLTNFWPEAKAAQVSDVRIFAWLHVILGWALLGWIVLLVLPLLVRYRSLRADLREVTRVGLGDYLWVQHVGLRLMGSESRAPRAGKFNAGQKLNSVLFALLTVALLGTGVVLGVNYTTKSVFDVSFVEDVFPWHTALALLTIPPILGHLYLALLHPSTRGALRGMVLGVVRREWAREHHPAWVEQVEEAEAEPAARREGP